MTLIVKHPYHLVDGSPWPLFLSLSLFCLAINGVLFFHYFLFSELFLYLSFSLVLICSIRWWTDIVREGTFQGFHTKEVQFSLKLGFFLFIISEIFFFLGFFWAFFHSAISPSIEIGAIWPPIGIKILNPFEVPFLNTCILLVSGAFVTVSHYAVILGLRQKACYYLLITLSLALFFTFLQGLEYFETEFDISDGIFGSVFFLATGFHGIHVFIGTIFLFVSFFRILFYHFTTKHHLGFEMSVWYWHFVDVVWLFLYLFIYWWTSLNF
jgi:cytochrome c oxidase subunit 3